MKVIELPAQPTLSVRKTIPVQEIGTLLSQVLPRIFAIAMRDQLGPGFPYARYHTEGQATVNLEAGLVLQSPGKAEGEIQPGQLPKTKAATAWHAGPYEQLQASWKALNADLAKEKLTASGPGWEVYVSDPAAEPNPEKWRTQLVVPVK